MSNPSYIPNEVVMVKNKRETIFDNNTKVVREEDGRFYDVKNNDIRPLLCYKVSREKDENRDRFVEIKKSSPSRAFLFCCILFYESVLGNQFVFTGNFTLSYFLKFVNTK